MYPEELVSCCLTEPKCKSHACFRCTLSCSTLCAGAGIRRHIVPRGAVFSLDGHCEGCSGSSCWSPGERAGVQDHLQDHLVMQVCAMLFVSVSRAALEALSAHSESALVCNVMCKMIWSRRYVFVLGQIDLVCAMFSF